MKDGKTPEARIVAPGQGKVLRAFGDEMTVLLDGEATGGAFAMLHNVAPAGFELFFEACADEFAQAGGPSMERIREIFDDYGLRFEDV